MSLEDDDEFWVPDDDENMPEDVDAPESFEEVIIRTNKNNHVTRNRERRW